MAAAAAATGLVLAAHLIAPAEAVPPADPVPDPSRSVVLPRLVARATMPAAEEDDVPGANSEDPAADDDTTTALDAPVITGFAAAVAHRNGTFWALPDQSDASPTSPSDVLLRLSLIRPRWERVGGGAGAVHVLRDLALSDPYRHVPFPIVREDTRDRRLTAADLDLESLQRMPDGTFWVGEERGPFLVHLDARGRVLSAPVPSPLGDSPQNPDLGEDAAATQARRRVRGDGDVSKRALSLPHPGKVPGRRRGR